MQIAKTKAKNVERHYQESQRLALEVVEERARTILKAHKGHLREFIMGMGRWCFTDLRNEIIYDQPAYIINTPLARFIDQWDEYLKLRGEPMRFTATGPKVTDW